MFSLQALTPVASSSTVFCPVNSCCLRPTLLKFFLSELWSEMCLLLESGSAVQNPPAMQEMQVQSLGQEDPLEKDMATHSIILAWEIPCTEEPGRLQSVGLQKSQT